MFFFKPKKEVCTKTQNIFFQEAGIPHTVENGILSAPCLDYKVSIDTKEYAKAIRAIQSDQFCLIKGGGFRSRTSFYGLKILTNSFEEFVELHEAMESIRPSHQLLHPLFNTTRFYVKKEGDDVVVDFFCSVLPVDITDRLNLVEFSYDKAMAILQAKVVQFCKDRDWTILSAEGRILVFSQAEIHKSEKVSVHGKLTSGILCSFCFSSIELLNLSPKTLITATPKDLHEFRT